MAYDDLLERQRAAFISALGGTPNLYTYSHLELMFLYLGTVELRTEPTLLERLYGWAVVNNIPMTLAVTSVGF